MCFKHTPRLITLALIGSWMNMALAAQNVPEQKALGQGSLSVQPASCVALHQGRTCFAQLSLNWQTPGAGDFCIYLKDSHQLVHCWNNSRGNLVSFEFESKKKIVFQLVKKGHKNVLAETSVDVSWVHKATPRKRRWRLF